MLGGRLDVSYGQNKFEGGSYKHLGATANVVLTPGHRPANFHPYLLAGGGIYHVRVTGGTNRTKPALNGGLGIQLHLGHRTDLYLEGRFISILSDPSTNFIPVTVGFRWGRI